MLENGENSVVALTLYTTVLECIKRSVATRRLLLLSIFGVMKMMVVVPNLVGRSKQRLSSRKQVIWLGTISTAPRILRGIVSLHKRPLRLPSPVSKWMSHMSNWIGQGTYHSLTRTAQQQLFICYTGDNYLLTRRGICQVNNNYLPKFITAPCNLIGLMLWCSLVPLLVLSTI